MAEGLEPPTDIRGTFRAFSSSLHFRLLLLVFLAVLPAFTLILYSEFEHRREAMDWAIADAQRTVRSEAFELEERIRESRPLLIAMAHLPQVRSGDPEGCSATLAEMLKSYSTYANLLAIRPDGVVYCSGVPPTEVVSFADRPYFQRVLQTKDLVVGDFVIGRITGKAVLPIVYPVLDERGEIKAVVQTPLDLRGLNERMGRTVLPSGSTITVIDRAGNIVARQPDPEKWVGKSAAPDVPIVKVVMDQEAEGTIEAVGVDGIKRLYAYTPLRQGSEVYGYLFAGIPSAVVFAEPEKHLIRDLILFGVVTLLALLAAYSIGNELIMRRVKALLDATRRIQAGDLGARTGEIDGKGELGQLAFAFDQMAGALEMREAQRNRAEDEIHRLNAELEWRVIQRTAELEAANKELETFAYSVSHDLRAPLRSIDGFSRTLLEDCADKLDTRGRDDLQRIVGASQRMAGLIDDILKLSRITRSAISRESVGLSAMARDIAAELQRTQPERQVEFAIAPGVVVNGDAKLLRILLENLLGNAWKFTGERPQARIEFGILEHEGKPAYFVRDNGAGFDMTYSGKLFAPFQRLHAMTEFPGSGIGLSIVQRIVHRHGGHVWAEGKVREGATFYFTLN